MIFVIKGERECFIAVIFFHTNKQTNREQIFWIQSEWKIENKSKITSMMTENNNTLITITDHRLMILRIMMMMIIPVAGFSRCFLLLLLYSLCL